MGSEVPVVDLAYFFFVTGLRPGDFADPDFWTHFLLDPFHLWLPDFFGGVPKDAKTVGAAATLMASKEPIQQYIGAQMLRGAIKGRVISESTGSKSFEAHLTSLGSHLLRFRNQLPKGYWTVTGESGNTLTVSLQNIPPPPGAPYTGGVDLLGFQIPKPVTVERFLEQHGFPQLKDSEIAQLINQERLPNYDDRRLIDTNDQTLFNIAECLIFVPLLEYLSGFPAHPPPPPPPELGPLTEIQNCVCNIEQAFTGLISQLPALLSTDALATLADCVCPSLQQIAKSIDAIKPTDVAAIAKQLEAINTTLEKGKQVDLSGIVDQLKKFNADRDIPQDLINLWVQQGAVDAASAQLIGGAPPERWITNLLTRVFQAISQKVLAGEMNAAKDDPLIGGTFTKITTGKGKSVLDFADVKPSDVRTYILESVEAFFKDVFNASKGTFGELAATVLKARGDELDRIVINKPGDELGAAGVLLGQAFGFGTAAHFAAVVGETLFFTKQLGLAPIAALLAEVAGFSEIIRNVIGPEMEMAVGRRHRQWAAGKFKPDYPSEMDATIWHSRRLLSDDDLREVFKYSPLQQRYEDPFLKSAFRAVQPFILAAGFQDADYDESQLRALFEFNGYRDQDINLILNSVHVRSLANIRNSYVAEAATAYGAGVVSDQEFQDILTEAGWGKAAISMATKRALLVRRVNLAKQVESQVRQLVRQGLLAPEQGKAQLEAAGIQEWQANLTITLATTEADLLAARKELSAEAKALTQEKRNLTRAAVEQYRAGNLDDAAFSAALLAIGDDPTLIAAYLSLEKATKGSKQRLVFGRMLSPAAAELLREQVSALERQYMSRLIDDAEALNQLTGLQIPSPEKEALIARWAAARGKPKTTAEKLPI